MRGFRKKYPLKSRYFTAVGSSSVKMVVDTEVLFIIPSAAGNEFFGGININHLDGL